MRTLEAYTTPEQFAGLAPFWDRLGTYLDAPMGSYQWVLASAETLVADARLFVPVVRDGSTPVALACLVAPTSVPRRGRSTRGEHPLGTVRLQL